MPGAAAKYDFAFNWYKGGEESAFARAVREEARRRRVRVLAIDPAAAERVRRKADRRTLSIGLFLNTQAGAASFDTPAMRLACSVKAAGGLVVEDPDDSPFYANRIRAYERLRRAGVGVVPHVAVSDWHKGRTVLTARERTRLGVPWMARYAAGYASSARIESKSRRVGPAVRSAGFRAGRELVLERALKPALFDGRPAVFRLFHFFGELVPAWWDAAKHRAAPVSSSEFESFNLASLAEISGRVASTLGLDWFMTQVVATGSADKPRFVVVEPANALGGIGPGRTAAAAAGEAVQRIAAERIVEVAWRWARRRPLVAGASIRLARSWSAP
jgi:hypothetical protein